MSGVAHRFARTAAEVEKQPPKVNVRFFYTSPLPIDDPLSPVPPPLTSLTPTTRLPPRPFSEYDNTALDKAWNELRRKILKHREETDAEKGAEALLASIQRENARNIGGLRRSPLGTAGTSLSDGLAAGTTPTPPSTTWGTGPKSTSRAIRGSESNLGDGRAEPSFYGTRPRSSSLRTSLAILDQASQDTGSVTDPGDQGLTGMPFARVPSRKQIPTTDTWREEASSSPFESALETSREDELRGPEYEKAAKIRLGPDPGPTAKVAVGVSRLHQVMMPDLQMAPIYWLPVHDIATIIRGTWFYKDSMLPVEVDVANMLESGYLRLRPWTDTWSDELNSAVEVGAIGEEKIQHLLWPEPAIAAIPSSRPGTSSSTRLTLDGSSPEERRAEIVQIACDLIDVATSADGLDTKAFGNAISGKDGQQRVYVGSSVIYANEREAYILRPNLQPSAYYGRRPLANYIRKGHGIGVPVVRGFDQVVWDRLNPSKSGKKSAAAQEGVSTSQAGPGGYRRMQSDPSLSNSRNPLVTDLILVVHGIGQKLSERVESYHFTHAMNNFRREVNVELGTNSVKPHLRKDMGGIMVLPVNWRAALSFEEGGYRDGPEDPSGNQYTLKDITPESLQSVRNIISDVMLDIPYYLSHHQPTMLAAVIQEANRVHRLWCLNNPGFEQYGRVHIMAHSLGSVMALDILSKQPTAVEPQSPAVDDHLSPQHFRFDTRNLYLCGSPVGFFLLLSKATLLPRRDRNKPSADGDDASPGVAGEEGTYGCLAVDNIYNIVNPYDPVAYRVNATVDATYAASLKPAFIPSASSSWFSFGGSTFRGVATSAAAAVTSKPSMVQRLPSNVELETHNFTREEIAEKRFYLLNDNGQIDFFLRYGGGALEIQYLTMLGAHSSYWISKDFVRFVVVETGRKLGRDGTLNAVRAAKKKGAFAV